MSLLLSTFTKYNQNNIQYILGISVFANLSFPDFNISLMLSPIFLQLLILFFNVKIYYLFFKNEKMKRKILVISHDFVKKVNIKVYEELSKVKNLDILCLRPKKLIIKKKVFNKDYDLKTSKVKINENKIILKN